MKLPRAGTPALLTSSSMRRVTREHRVPRRRLDGGPVANVAGLVLVGVRGRAPREADHV